MHVTREHIEEYLSDVRAAIRDGTYRISSRYKNMDMYIDYLFTEEDTKQVLLSLRPEDFAKVVQNAHAGHSEEVLYIFGKDVKLLPRFGGEEETVPFYLKLNKSAGRYVIVVSLHKQEHPLSYPFKVCA